MSFNFTCPFCGKMITAEEEWEGQQAECPFCNNKITINKPIELKPVNDQPILQPIYSQNNGNNGTSPQNGVKVNNIRNNPNMKLLQQVGCFSVYEHQQDLSNAPAEAMFSYFMSKMNVRKRQVLIDLNGNAVKMQAGAMQWMSGNVDCETGLGSGMNAIGGFLKGAIKSMVTGESIVKPLYSGYGNVMLEPTYKYIIVEDLADWGEQGIVLQDSLFLACDANLKEKIVSRKNISSLLGAGEGIFNLSLSGKGAVVLESPVPKEEMYEFELNDSVLKIDGNMAIAWSASLELTVERSSKSIIGSMTNGEGLLNVYRGTGKVLMTPTLPGTLMENGAPPTADKSSGGSVTKGILDGIGNVLSN